MSRTAKQERVEQILGELAELGLMLAKDLAIHAREAEDTEAKVALTEAFHQTSRTVRLTLALDAKLDRDAARDARDAEREAAAQEAALAADTQLRESRIMQAAWAADLDPDEITPEENQKRRVRNVLNRLIWNESEGDEEEYEVLLADLDARLYEIEDAPGFADLPIEVVAGKLAKDMGLSGEMVITTAERFARANPPPPPLADTG